MKHMSRIFIGSLLWAAVVLVAHGKVGVIRMTPGNLRSEREEFVFAVTSRPATNGVFFHVTITAKTGVVPPDSECELCFFRRTTNSKYTVPATPQTEVALKKGPHVWKAHFVASKELLNGPDTAFVFHVYYPEGPTADFYVFMLRDFIKKPVESKAAPQALESTPERSYALKAALLHVFARWDPNSQSDPFLPTWTPGGSRNAFIVSRDSRRPEHSGLGSTNRMSQNSKT